MTPFCLSNLRNALFNLCLHEKKAYILAYKVIIYTGIKYINLINYKLFSGLELFKFRVYNQRIGITAFSADLM